MFCNPPFTFQARVRGRILGMCEEFHSERNKRMNYFSSALQRSRKSVMASATVLALTALAFTVPGTLHGEREWQRLRQEQRLSLWRQSEEQPRLLHRPVG